MKDHIKSKLINNKGYIIFMFLTLVYAVVWYIKKDRSIINSDGREYFQYFSRIFISHNFPQSNLIKYPVGTTLMQLPFLLVGYIVSVILGINLSEDISIIELAMYISSWFYCLFGLTLIYGYIKKYYSAMAALMTSIGILFGTMLVLYTTEKASMSHVYGFFMCTFFMIYVERYEARYEGLSGRSKFLMDILLGVILGIIALIRNTNIIIGFVYLIYGVETIKAFGSRLKKLFGMKILVQIAGFVGIYIMQIICWRIQTGEFILYSYVDESFTYWNHPQIINVLFSDAKGLFIYSPILIVSIIGLFLKRKDSINNVIKWIVFIVQTYIIAAWWCWWLGAAYSERMYCDILCIFAIPTGTFFYRLFEYAGSISLKIRKEEILQKVIMICILGICMLFIALNLIWIQGCYEYRISANFGTWYMLKMYLKSSFKNFVSITP